MALTSHGWSGIWNLGSLDVHPIGYYMLLNLVRLVFGEHVVAYRLMSAAASCALVVAGYAMMRRGWGARAARLFAALACFAPPFMRMAFQIRMYSWAVLAVTMCFLFAMRICIKARGSGPVRVTEWIGFALFSLAGAYRHYYAVLVVTIINAIVLAASGRRDIRCATRCGLKTHGGISGLCRRIWAGFASATAGIWPCSLIPGKSL